MSAIAHEPGTDVVVDLVDAVAVLGSFPALAGATLSVRRGEIVLLRGPNGAGKTTLLRLCAGLVPLERGQGQILGVDLVRDRELVRHRVGMIGHNNGLYSDLTVTENVRFWGRTVGASTAEVDAALHRMGLDGRLANLPISRLSAGQKRRTLWRDWWRDGLNFGYLMNRMQVLMRRAVMNLIRFLNWLLLPARQ